MTDGGTAAGNGRKRFTVSVIIPARNEETSIARCLDAVLSQTRRPDEVIVIDAMSDDRTAEIVRGFIDRGDPVRLFENPQRVTPAALNLGLRATGSDFLVRIDAHAVPGPDYVERIVALLEDGTYAGVGGVKIAVGGDTTMSAAIASGLTSRFGVGGSAYHYATEPQEVDHIPFGAYRTDVLRELGGWDDRLLVNQDFELDYRMGQAGHRILLDPRIRVMWKSSQNLRDLAHQYARYGSGKAVVARIHPRSLKPRHVLPPLAFAGVGAVTAAAAIARKPRWLALLGPYAGVLLLGPTDRTLRGDWRQTALAPLVLATMHMSWGYGFWRGVTRGVPKPGGPVRDDFRDRDLSQGL